jgi:hypothetical protein
MTARILQFPSRGPFAVSVLHDRDGAWLVVCRERGWLFGSQREALADASEIAAGFGVAVDIVPPTYVSSERPQSHQCGDMSDEIPF